MKRALISPIEPVSKVVSWEQVDGSWIPVFETIPGSARVADVVETSFDVAPPLFWTDCDDDVLERSCYYNTEQDQILGVDHAPHPNPPPTRSSGTIPSATL